MNKLYQLLVLFALAIAVSAYYPEDAPNDYQTATYYADFQPTTADDTVTVTTYFSPDNSISTETNAIVNAKVSIDIGTPGFESWIGCTTKGDPDGYGKYEDSSYSSYGCTVDKQRNEETFPIFQALLNAIHRGVHVRILSNLAYKSNETFSEGYIDPISFLAVAGAEVRYFTTLTFLHSKYMMIDNATASVSSINYSQTSFMNNREAGVLLSGSKTLTDFYYAVYETDWNMGIEWPTNQYSSSDMKIIDDTTPLTVTIPAPTSYPGSTPTTVTTTTAQMEVTAITSPDNSFELISADIQKSDSLKVYIYQITGDVWCDLIGNYSGSTLDILVSTEIYDKTDYYMAEKCYKNLYSAGVTIRKTAKNSFVYSHQKIWILDDDRVYVSTGNWGNDDFPDGSMTFPSYKAKPYQWRRTNRDFSIKISNSDVVSTYTSLFSSDYEKGYDYYPSDTEAQF